MITAPSFKPLNTELFDRRDPHSYDDSVFAVKDGLIVEFLPRHGDPKAQFELEFNFKLARKEDEP
ncbi:uncharacterized protein Z520_07720 [Fonsecaea multimorphosa CBS 102226]|uniref:Uncharacterized protein n=1 Tax=Fonsecaea multimorphosa CBS 102226 TaxID=1442371 RepID=A0A0D2K0K3_9EURO|nr:uncharacterized protein Z520_07720 [Fonsecaea multimorphosa CBS 102226]KIX96454.1 hypothetical protein Z520_07720 [Fonsecaea multimorphosa CBS 102226]